VQSKENREASIEKDRPSEVSVVFVGNVDVEEGGG
jgi:hypothetical protein